MRWLAALLLVLPAAALAAAFDQDAFSTDAFSTDAFDFDAGPDVTAPTLVGASLNRDRDELHWQLSEAVSAGAGGTGGGALTCSGGAVTPTYASAGSAVVHTLSRTIAEGETCTTAYTQPGDGFEDAAGNDLATFSSEPVSVPADCVGGIGPVLAPVLTPSAISLQCAY